MTNASSRTFCEAFQQTAAKHPDVVALRTPDDKTTVTWRQYADRVARIASGLSALDVRRGDTVALMMGNRPEFHILDTAALHAGAVPFSIYNTLAPEQIAYLFANAGNRVVICEEQYVEQLRAANVSGQVERIVCIDGNPAGTTTLAELEAGGDPDFDFDFDASWQAVGPGDVLTIIYTSGTTGPPKGVEITHQAVLAGIRTFQELLPTGADDRVISYLPDAHIANRWGVHYASLVSGIQVTTVNDPKQLIPTLPSVRPTFFAAVPQIWYKLKAALENAIEQEPSRVRRNLGLWAIGVGTKVAWLKSDGNKVPLSLTVQHALAERLVLGKLRAKLGLDQVRIAASGAAAIAPDALAFVLGLGLPVSECWGMSETSAVIILNPPGALRIGTVGTVLADSKVKLADDGELLVHGPTLMKGYRNDPEKTAEAIDAGGWLHTGDVATIDADGYVKLVDRKKEIIINAGGKNMSPSNIEGTVKACCPLVSSAVAIGDERPYIAALLTLDPDACVAYAAKHTLPDGSPTALAHDPGVRAVLEAGVKEANQKLSRVEQIKKFTILPALWQPGGDELTPTMKLRRKPIAEKYAVEIEALFATAGG